MRGWLPRGGVGVVGPRATLIACMILLGATAANAQYESDFESLNASPGGTLLTGQDGFYVPPGTDSVDWYAYTYAGNTLGLPDNPQGGSQFVGGTGPAAPTYARAQRDIFVDPSMSVWTFSYDFAATYLGTGASAQNVGSFSVRSSDVAIGFIHLLTWVDPNNPVDFNAFYLAYNAGGTMFDQPGQSPGAAWEGLALNHWYHAWTTVDFGTNKIVEVGIIDLETGDQSTSSPADWYLDGGQAGGGGPPTSFRLFAGGGVFGNAVGFDNVSINAVTATGACCFPDASCRVLSGDECAAAGGDYQGDGSTCDPNPCIPVPVEATSWGRIKAGYR